MSDNVSGSGIKVKSGGYVFPWIASGIALILFFSAQYFSVMLMGAAGLEYSRYNGSFMLLYSCFVILLLAPVAIFLKRFFTDKDSGVMLGRPKISGILPVLIIALGLLGIVNTYMFFVQLVTKLMESGVVNEELDKYRESVDRYSEVDVLEVPGFDKILYYISAVILVPFAEELLFRGIIMGSFLKRYKPVIAVIISALLFGIGHGISIHIGYAFISGIILGLVYLFFGNMLYTYLIHMIFNLLGGALYLILTDGWFDISANVTVKIMNYIVILEYLTVLPAILVLFIVGFRYKSSKKTAIQETQDKGQGEVSYPEEN